MAPSVYQVAILTFAVPAHSCAKPHNSGQRTLGLSVLGSTANLWRGNSRSSRQIRQLRWIEKFHHLFQPGKICCHTMFTPTVTISFHQHDSHRNKPASRRRRRHIPRTPICPRPFNILRLETLRTTLRRRAVTMPRPHQDQRNYSIPQNPTRR